MDAVQQGPQVSLMKNMFNTHIDPGQNKSHFKGSWQTVQTEETHILVESTCKKKKKRLKHSFSAFLISYTFSKFEQHVYLKCARVIKSSHLFL